jgi:type IV secretion system protein VirB9
VNTKRRNTALLAGLLSLVALDTSALETPHPGQLDKRVRFIDFQPSEVVKLVGHYGFSTDIQFSPTEKVNKIAIGDKAAWDIAPIDNHLFIKAVGDKALTNMTVLTNRHVYNFELSAHWSENGASPRPNDMMFQINFNYPEDIAAVQQAKAEAEILKAKLNAEDEQLPENWNYWAKGSSGITPNIAFDDGRFTYLKFKNNRAMPAIYIINDDDSESLVNTHIDPKKKDTIVVHKVVKQLVLRKGKSVVCLFNKSFDPDGIPNERGTTIKDVRRVIKGQGL